MIECNWLFNGIGLPIKLKSPIPIFSIKLNDWNEISPFFTLSIEINKCDGILFKDSLPILSFLQFLQNSIWPVCLYKLFSTQLCISFDRFTENSNIIGFDLIRVLQTVQKTWKFEVKIGSSIDSEIIRNWFK